uniref:Uncharacterized protein n=1 Tax=viral metagenome TaxID=1070528 RepID=A0A6C0H5L4_9ZZZZ
MENNRQHIERKDIYNFDTKGLLVINILNNSLLEKKKDVIYEIDKSKYLILNRVNDCCKGRDYYKGEVVSLHKKQFGRYSYVLDNPFNIVGGATDGRIVDYDPDGILSNIINCLSTDIVFKKIHREIKADNKDEFIALLMAIIAPEYFAKHYAKRNCVKRCN